MVSEQLAKEREELGVLHKEATEKIIAQKKPKSEQKKVESDNKKASVKLAKEKEKKEKK